MQLGKVAMEVFPPTDTLRTETTAAGDVLYILGRLLAVVMWGFRLCGCYSHLLVLAGVGFRLIWGGGDLHFRWGFLLLRRR
jgi:hypothetical protein